uniref:Uncharacterized protein n=1 Tax=Quercus lobata TaxID=97700 RepID=A0A7N2LDA8_QUELO
MWFLCLLNTVGYIFGAKRRSIKSFFEETLVAIPDSVMDSPVAEPLSGRDDLFENIDSLLPTPYKLREQEVLYA